MLNEVISEFFVCIHNQHNNDTVVDLLIRYIDRFQALRETVFRDPDSFFQHYAHLTDAEAVEMARSIWREINGKNLVENIDPTKSRASLLVKKGADHRVTKVNLRRL